MTLFAHLPEDEKEDMKEAWLYLYNQGELTMDEFKDRLGKLGYNATKIEETLQEADTRGT